MTFFYQPQRSDAYRTREVAYWVRTMTTLLKAHARSTRFITDAAAYNPVSEALAKLLQWQMGDPGNVQNLHIACDIAHTAYNDLLGRSPSQLSPASDAGRETLTGLLLGYFARNCPHLNTDEQAWGAAFYALTLSDDVVRFTSAVLEDEERS